MCYIMWSLRKRKISGEILVGRWQALAAIILLPLGATLLSTCNHVDQEKALNLMDKFIPDKILGWEAKARSETYDRETIFDYIDGAGEIYRQYGFRMLYVKRLIKTRHPTLTVELYDMGSSDDAYGIFSHSRWGEDAGIGQGSEYRGRLLCFWKGRYFVCVSTEKQTEQSSKAVLALARQIEGKIKNEGRPPEIVDYLPDDGLVNSSVRYFHNHTILNYHYFLAEQNLLNLSEQTEAVFAIYQPGQIYLLCVRYQNQRLAEEALDSFMSGYVPESDESELIQIEDNNWLNAVAYENFVVIVFDAPDSHEAEKLVNAVREKIAGYASKER